MTLKGYHKFTAREQAILPAQIKAKLQEHNDITKVRSVVVDRDTITIMINFLNAGHLLELEGGFELNIITISPQTAETIRVRCKKPVFD